MQNVILARSWTLRCSAFQVQGLKLFAVEMSQAHTSSLVRVPRWGLSWECMGYLPGLTDLAASQIWCRAM